MKVEPRRLQHDSVDHEKHHVKVPDKDDGASCTVLAVTMDDMARELVSLSGRSQDTSMA